jgi:hypothetical protein
VPPQDRGPVITSAVATYLGSFHFCRPFGATKVTLTFYAPMGIGTDLRADFLPYQDAYAYEEEIPMPGVTHGTFDLWICDAPDLADCSVGLSDRGWGQAALRAT